MRLCIAARILFVGLSLISCSGPRTVGSDNSIRHEVRRIALSPSGGAFVDAIAQNVRDSENNTAELLSTQSTAELLKRLGVMGARATQPESLAQLRAEGIDAWMRVEVGAHQIADTPQNVEVRVTSTHDAQQFIDFKWHNGQGGMRGSIADATMRKNSATAAKLIAEELVERLNAEPPRN